MHHNAERILKVGSRLIRNETSRSQWTSLSRSRTLNQILRHGSRSLCTDKVDAMKQKQNLGSTFVPHQLGELPVIDTVIIGGGLVGMATAYWLSRKTKRTMNIAVIERDYGYTQAATMLSVGGIRHQFSLEENVEMSMFTTEFLRNIKEHLSVIGTDEDPPDVQFHHQGYLFLASQCQAQELNECVQLQRAVGAQTEMMSKERLSTKFPWLNLDGVECGSYGVHGEGWFDPWLLLKALKQKNISLGVHYIKGEVFGFEFDKSNFIRQAKIRYDGDKESQVEGSIFINAAGPWAGSVAELAGVGLTDGIPLPVAPRKRYVYVAHCPNGPGLEAPLTVDTNGSYFRREGLGGCYLFGQSPEKDCEPDCSNLDVDYNFFDEKIWPSIAKRVPGFEKLKIQSAWAGYYDYNYFDQNLIIGPHPHIRNFYFGNGMSGHGLQQGVAIGNALAELIVDGEYSTIDLNRLQFDRVIADMPIPESAIV